MTISTYAVPLFVGYVIGCLVAYILWRFVRKPDGYFIVNLVNPEDEMFKLQIDVPLEELPKVKYLIFRVRRVQ